MVTTTSAYADSRYRASAGEGYDGVVRVSVGGFYGTGALLFDGRAILTAAHLFSHDGAGTSVSFETVAGNRTVDARKVLLHPGYDPVDGNHDIALVWLTEGAPAPADRYSLYRRGDELGKAFTLVGYGRPGSGAGGAPERHEGSPIRLRAGNEFDADMGTLKSYLGRGMAWVPEAGTQLAADFDDGSPIHDALGRLIYRIGTGLGMAEGLIAPGDSGGPAFIDGKVAGVANYTASLANGSADPDVDTLPNSSFGEIAAWQRVSAYQQWLDQSLRAEYPDAPASPGEVKKELPEGHSGTTLAYFLVRFTGTRDHPDQWLSVNYATRDGTATAGTDYIAASGKLILYPNEAQAVIPVEIIGDPVREPDETFYLDVTDPVGGSFGKGIVTLTAVRTIVDDDGF